MQSTKQGVLSISTKAQAWYADFAVALLLFIFTLAVYFSYINNVQREEKSGLDVVIKDAKAISSALVLSGYPTNWTNETVIRVGIADDHKLNSIKLRAFKRLNYSITKKYFGTIYNYFVYFVDKKGEPLNINSVCGAGYPLINTSYNIKSAYYYQDPADSFLKDFMKDTFNADIYFDDNPLNFDDIDGLISNLSKYSLLVLEHPGFPTSVLDNHYRELNNYTARGGHLILSGRLVAAASEKYLNGIRFLKRFGDSDKNEEAIVTNSDEHLALNVGDSMQFKQYYHVTNDTPPTIETDPDNPNYNPVPAVNFKNLSTYTNFPEDIAIARWDYGNGTVYFFSDFDVSAFNGNFLQVVEDLTTSFIGGTCTPINISVISPKNLARIERYLTYNSQVVKMVVYVWQ